MERGETNNETASGLAGHTIQSAVNVNEILGQRGEENQP